MKFKGKSITIFCGSSEAISPIFAGEIEMVARLLVKHGITVVFGGTRQGLMGKLASSALEAGGQVIGVVPEALSSEEAIVPGLSKLEVVPALSHRKLRMLELGDVLVGFPGGIGTLDEITEVMALKSLGQLEKPLVLYNMLDYWSPFLTYCQELNQMGMIQKPLEDYFTVVETVHELESEIKRKL